MNKIASPRELQTELTALLRYAGTSNPSRRTVAARLKALSCQVVGQTREAREYPNENGPETPWGPSQSVELIAPGVNWFTTAGHGGLGVVRSIARESLSKAARACGDLMLGQYWYEEDIAYAIPIYENEEWNEVLARKTGARLEKKEALERKIRQSIPQYFALL